jgi:microcystin-dependent protein
VVLAKGVDSVGTAIPLLYAPAGTATPAAIGGLNVAGTVTVANAGNSQPVWIVQPYQCITWVIALQGISPSRN